MDKETVTQTLQERIRRFGGFMKNTVGAFSVRAGHAGYRFCYCTGMQTLRFLKYTGRRAARILAPAGRFLFKGADFLLLRHLRALGREICRFGQGFGLAAERVRQAYTRHPLLTIPQVLFLPVLAVKRHRKAVISLLNLAAPAAATVALVFTVQYWSNMTFALTLEYGGQKVGYISDESVFDAAANMATERVINTDNSFEVERTPKLTLAVAPKAQMLDETALCDKILESSSDSITQASGLYIDDKFEGAVASSDALNQLLDDIRGQYLSGAANERAEFVQEVRVVDGLYPVTSVVDSSRMKAYLTSETIVEKRYEAVWGDSVSRIAAKHDMTMSELRAMNPGLVDTVMLGDELVVQRAQPYLRVQVVKTVEYTESIPYTTEKIQDTNQYVGYEKVKTKGQEGTKKITAEITEIDGVEQSRKILSTSVVKEAVNKVVVVGAKKYNNSAGSGSGVVTGKFTWPIPAGRVVSSPYGYRNGRFHAGVDLSGGVLNKPIVAADGGTVVEVNASGYGGGYGLYVIIDHGGGYRTVYAHCNKIMVTKGQKVSKSDIIALAGNTGNSRGPHLHCEIRLNGKSVNPLPYIK